MLDNVRARIRVVLFRTTPYVVKTVQIYLCFIVMGYVMKSFQALKSSLTKTCNTFLLVHFEQCLMYA